MLTEGLMSRETTETATETATDTPAEATAQATVGAAAEATAERTAGARVGRRIRRIGLRALTSSFVQWAYRPALNDVATIFMLHRFADPANGVEGQDPGVLRDCLAWLRRRDAPVLSLQELFEREERGAPVPSGAVCFTVDDGYYDFSEVALEAFADYDIPVTVFLPTGFIDGDCWLWWDRVRYVIRRTERSRLPAVLPDVSAVRVNGGGDRDRKRVVDRVVAALERLPDARRRRAIRALADAAGVEIPGEPPSTCRPMTWEEVRSAESRGARFAPHTVDHPVLSKCSDERVRREVQGSWARLREEVEHPVPVFAYPQGSEWAFGEREKRAVEASGLQGAVSAAEGYAPGTEDGRFDARRWSLPRFAFPDERPQFLRIVSGLLRIQGLVSGVPALLG